MTDTDAAMRERARVWLRERGTFRGGLLVVCDELAPLAASLAALLTEVATEARRAALVEASSVADRAGCGRERDDCAATIRAAILALGTDTGGGE